MSLVDKPCGNCRHPECTDCYPIIFKPAKKKRDKIPRIDEVSRLVDAAPDMLNALKRCILALKANGAPNCEAVKEALKAIDKAEGYR